MNILELETNPKDADCLIGKPMKRDPKVSKPELLEDADWIKI